MHDTGIEIQYHFELF